MVPADFLPSAAGLVVKSVQGYWTFEPNMLPPDLLVDWQVVTRLSEAERALGGLDRVSRMLPNPKLLLRPFIRREAVLSSRIEGTITRLDQLLLFEAEPNELHVPSDAEEVTNYVRAFEFGIQQIQSGYPISLPLIRELHRILLTGVRGEDKRPGELRDRPVLIGRSGQTFETARFVPPCHTKIEPLMQNLIDFVRSTERLPDLARIAIMHYQFETIHPFNDGNGRVGRLLITLMLSERKILIEPYLYFSGFFEQNRQEYYDGLLDVSRIGAWNNWISYFAYGLTVQAGDAATRTSRLLELRDRYLREAIDAVRSKSVYTIVDALFESPFISLKKVVEISGLTLKTAQTTIEKIVAKGLLREITGRQRNRIFCADTILKMLDDPIPSESS